MKVAISGKGGVGKSTIAAAISIILARQNHKVLAVDADPDANLASALGITSTEQKNIIPISKQIKLIEERTGAKIGQYGQVFKLNPEVADVADNYAYEKDGVSLLVLGAVEKGGSGCACPENIFIRSLITDLVLYKDESLIMDMEAGVEHLGRATTSGVDLMLIVVEPGQRSIECAERVIRMSAEIGIKKVCVVGNKVRNSDDEEFIKNALKGTEVLAFIPSSDNILTADRDGVSVLDKLNDDENKIFEELVDKINEL